ncbi:MAG: OsmC family protein [Bacteroidetes bacterium]|nr:OsmC family protein [Bacteroidota bacterium]
MSEVHDYVVGLTWDKERIGTLSAPGLDDQIVVATPPQFPKGVEGIWSPEHLFVSAITSCFMTTFLSIAENSKLPFTSFECKGSGSLETVNGKYMVSEVTVFPKVVIADAKDRDRTERILQKTEANCLISNSVKSAIIMKTEVIVDENAIV